MIALLELFKWARLKRPKKDSYIAGLSKLQSPLERLFWKTNYATLAQMGRLTPQVRIAGYYADFVLDEIPDASLVKIAIEVDGREYHTTEEQVNYDKHRDRVFVRNGYLVLRYPGSEVYRDCQSCATQIKQVAAYWRKRDQLMRKVT